MKHAMGIGRMPVFFMLVKINSHWIKTDCYQHKHDVNATIFGIQCTVVLIHECTFYIDDIHSSPPRIIGFAPIIDRSQKDTAWNEC